MRKSINYTRFFIILTLFTFNLNAQECDEESYLVESKIITLHLDKQISTTDVYIDGANGNVYMLTTSGNGHQIYQIDQNGMLTSKFEGGYLDSLSSPNAFFKLKDKFIIVDYVPRSGIIWFDVLDEGLKLIEKKQVTDTSYGLFKYLPSKTEFFFSQFTAANNDNIITYHVNSWDNGKEVLSINKKLKAPPSRGVKFFFEPTPKNIIACFDDVYEVFIYNYEGNKLKNFTNPHFKNSPYSETELKLMSPMKAALSKQYEPYPPVIDGLHYIFNKILIIRKQRPGQKFIEIDLFGLQGQFECSITLDLKMNKFIKSFHFDNNLAILEKGKDGGKIFIRMINLTEKSG